MLIRTKRATIETVFFNRDIGRSGRRAEDVTMNTDQTTKGDQSCRVEK
jgi:hypothetical protein